MQKPLNALQKEFFYREEDVNFSPWVKEMLSLLADSNVVEWVNSNTTSKTYRGNHYYINKINSSITLDNSYPGTNTSLIAPFFISLIRDLCKKHDLNFLYLLKLYAAATYHVPGEKHGDIHSDHDNVNWDYYHFILYLTDFTEGYTYIYDKEKKNVIMEFKPKKYKAVIFEKCFHAQGHCGVNEHRVVIAGTFIANKQINSATKPIYYVT